MGRGSVLGRVDGFPFQDEIVLPTQVGRRHDLPGAPERGLLLAVMEQAFKDLIPAKSDKGASVRAATIAWFESADTGWPFSCVAICERLGVDVGALRARLRAGGWRAVPRTGVRVLSRTLAAPTA